MEIKDISEIDDRILRQGSQIIISASGESFLKGFSKLINRFTRDKGSRGALLSTTWSANALTRRIGMSKLPKGSLKVIDTFSLSLGSKVPSSPDFIFLPTPVPLESILVEIERLIRNKNMESSFLILDSLTFINGYYTKGQLAEFFHYLLNRMLEEEITVVIFDQILDSDDPTKKLLTSIMDKSIILSDGGEQE